MNFLAAAGDTFSGDNRIPDNYAAAGININIPLFAGGKYNAATHRAEFQATAALDKLTDLENQVGRDVRIAWQNSLAGYEALSVSHELATYAEKSLSLAQSRYNLGLSSIVELNNAQLNAVDAEFQDVKTRYQYKLQMTQLDYETGVLQ